jgi:hypothetical protein
VEAQLRFVRPGFLAEPLHNPPQQRGRLAEVADRDICLTQVQRRACLEGTIAEFSGDRQGLLAGCNGALKVHRYPAHLGYPG